MKHTAKIRRYN